MWTPKINFLERRSCRQEAVPVDVGDTYVGLHAANDTCSRVPKTGAQVETIDGPGSAEDLRSGLKDDVAVVLEVGALHRRERTRPYRVS